MPQQTLGHHPPPLRMVKNTRVFLYARIKHHRPHNVDGRFNQRRRAQHQAKRRRQLLVNRRHAAFSLFRRSRATQHRPKLRVQVNLTFGIFFRAVNRAIFGNRPNKPIAIPGVALNVGVKLLAMGQRPGRFFRPFQPPGHLGVHAQPQTQLKSHKQTFAIIAQAQTIVPIRREAAGQMITPHALQIKFQRPPQMTKHRGLAGIGVGQHLVIKVKIAGFGHKRRHRIKKPEAVVGAVFLRIGFRFVAGVMVKRLDDGDGSAVSQLPGEQQLQPRLRLVGNGCGHAQNILHRIAEAQAIPLAVVDQTGGPRPGKGDQAVV